MVALDAQSRSLQRLLEVRRLSQSRAAEAQAWRGFAEKPPYPLALVEELRDAIASQRLEAQTDRMLLSISENGVARGAALLTECHKQVRLARDQAELAGDADRRRQWLLQLAEVRAQSNEAMLEASEVGRLVALEKLASLRQYLEFLERKLAAARAQARFSRADLDAVLARLNEKREELRRELGQVISRDAEMRQALAAARDELRQAQREGAGATPERLKDLGAVVEARQAQGEMSDLKMDLLRSFLILADYGQNIWEDRFWATGDRSITELRAKRQSHQNSFEGLLPWKKFAELRLSTASSQVLGQSIRASATNLTTLEREAARQVQACLEERARLYLRALSTLMMVESAHERLMADLAEREAGQSFAGNAQFVLDRIGSFQRRIWDTELYVAEDSVIADGQKISVPRTITLGKVVIALSIFVVGMLLARWGQGAVRRAASGWFKARERTASAVAKSTAGLVVVVALFVAMTSVRIPWTVFAFLGGALAIGVGFGAQTLINNFISGVILLFERSIRVGDIVEVGDQRGKVVNVGFRNSLIKRGDGIDVLVPNSRFLETEVVNWTLTDDLVRYRITVGAAYGSPPKKVSELITQAAAEHPDVLKHPVPQVLLDDFGDNALVFTLVFWMKLRLQTDGGIVRSELRYRIHELFEKAGVVLAYPQRDVHLDSVRPLEVRLLRTEPSPDERSPDPISKASSQPQPPGA